MTKAATTEKKTRRRTVTARDATRAAKEVSAVVEQASRYALIRDAVTYTEAAVYLREQVKPALKRLKAFREAILAPMRATLATQRDTLDGMAAPLTEAETVLKAGMLAWEEAESARIAKEEAAALAEAEEAARVEQAAEAQAVRDMGDEEAATEIEELEIAVVPPVVERTTRPVGIGMTLRWDAKVVDIKALCAAVAAGEVPINAVQPNMPVLRDMARKQKTDACWPGVEVFSVRGMTSR